MRIATLSPVLLSVAGIGLMVAADPELPRIPAGAHASPVAGAVAAGQPDLFRTSDRCLACHKGVSTSSGEDVSIGYDWRASMMANSARDPYWQAAVRREAMDHPEAAADIEAECSICHMPMARTTAVARGGQGEVFANLPIGQAASADAALAADGVSCAVCHQIQPDGLGDPSSFVGRFTLDTTTPVGQRTAFGPFDVEPGRQRLMHSATGFTPERGDHIQSSELCATCHTLITHSLGEGGETLGEFPEQVPYLEWRASAFADEGTTCQDCHMPEVGEPVPVTDVVGQPRENVSRHVFRGGNFFMIRMLNRYRGELGVTALPQEMELAATRTVEHLRASTATLGLDDLRVEGGRLEATVEVTNRAGHKFPTAYPSRRAWLEVSVTDAQGREVFRSGGFEADGTVAGNDNDADPARFEPHHATITSPDQVQIYEAILAGPDGAVTTGLLTATTYAKDNRLLPRGFDRAAAPDEVAVHGAAGSDADFGAPGDRVAYRIDLGGSTGPWQVEVRLWYQPIGARWATNLGDYDAFETNRFVGYWNAMAPASAVVIAETGTEVVAPER